MNNPFVTRMLKETGRNQNSTDADKIMNVKIDMRTDDMIKSPPVDNTLTGEFEINILVGSDWLKENLTEEEMIEFATLRLTGFIVLEGQII